MPPRDLHNLVSLATLLVERQPGTIVVPIVGAGASLAAGMPTFEELKARIYAEFTQQTPALAAVLQDEVERRETRVLDLPPFEFMSLVSRLAFGRRVIHEAIHHIMRHASHRPIAYELLAHLAKHRFIDHLISVNFDELLDESLLDEIPDRLCRIASTDDVPGVRAVRAPGACYFFKPFGTLARDGFRLEPNDVREFGTDSMWMFILETLFNRLIGGQHVVLVLVGYAAQEPAFIQLIRELTKRAESLKIYTVNPSRFAEGDLLDSGIDPRALFHVKMEADPAFDLLLQIMEIKHSEKNGAASWVPIARHRIISTLPYLHTIDHVKRFTMEVILQALKSRGFFTIEAIAEISRVQRYSNHAFDALYDMRQRGLLEGGDSNGMAAQNASSHHPGLVQSYALNNSAAADYVRQIAPRRQAIVKWTVRREGEAFRAIRRDMSVEAFIKEQFETISKAPDIEVTERASPSTEWLFSDRAKRLESVAALTRATATIIEDALSGADASLTLYGVWTTGEWLFHERGWAWDRFGLKLVEMLRAKRLNLNIVIADNPHGHTERQVRGKEIRNLLAQFETCHIYPVNWWQQNRVLTLVQWTTAAGSLEEAGIYMRRRLATPIVSPVLVRGDDCRVLIDVFMRYREKSRQRDSTGQAVRPAALDAER